MSLIKEPQDGRSETPATPATEHKSNNRMAIIVGVAIVIALAVIAFA
jgi:hypothetical protein